MFRLFSLLRAPESDGTGGAAGGAGDAGAGGAGGGAGGGGGAGAGAPGAGAAPVTDVRTFIDDKGNIISADKFFDKDTAHLSKRFTSVGAIAKSYVSLERQLSNSNKVALPGDNSTPEEWDAFFSKLGRPESADAYGLEVPEAVKDKALSTESVNEFKGLAFKLGMTPKQVTELGKWYFDTTGKQLESMEQAQTQQREGAVAALKKEWGANFDTQLALAKKAAVSVGGDELLAHPLANDPVFIKAMAAVGAKMTEGTLAGGRQGGPAPVDPKSEINRIMGDKKDPYWLAKHPQHEERVAHVQSLYQKAYPEPS